MSVCCLGCCLVTSVDAPTYASIRGVPIIGSADISAADMVLLPILVSVKNRTMTDIFIQ